METGPRVTRIIPAVSSVQPHSRGATILLVLPVTRTLWQVCGPLRTTNSVGSLMWLGGLWLSKLRRSSFPPTYDLAQI